MRLNRLLGTMEFPLTTTPAVVIAEDDFVTYDSERVTFYNKEVFYNTI